MNNNLQIVLQILPSTENNNEDLIKISENYVILSSIPKSLVFQFDQIVDGNSDQALYNDYFYNYIPNSTLHQLLKGHDTTIIIYNDDTNISSQDSFDMKLVDAFSALFESNLDQLEICISFFEFDQNNDDDISPRDLISSTSTQPIEYELDTIEQLKKYYLLGLNQHKSGHLFVFSILLKKNDEKHRINLIDIPNDSTDLLNQISDYFYFSPKSVIDKSPLLRILDQSHFLYFISSLQLANPVAQIQQKLSFTSNICQRLRKKVGDGFKSSPSQEDIQYLKRVISRLSNEVDSLRQESRLGRTASDASSYHDSAFSTTSYSTHLTSLPADEGKWLDSHHQIEDLERELLMTRETKEQALAEMRTTNLEMWAINEKQAQVIIKLEERLHRVEDDQAQALNQVKHDLHELSIEKTKLLDALHDQDIIDEFPRPPLETEQDSKTLLDRITKLNNDLESEKKNNAKLVKTNHILEKRIDDLITNKKSRFFCL